MSAPTHEANSLRTVVAREIIIFSYFRTRFPKASARYSPPITAAAINVEYSRFHPYFASNTPVANSTPTSVTINKINQTVLHCFFADSKQDSTKVNSTDKTESPI